jgi:CHAT domain-containing protein
MVAGVPTVVSSLWAVTDISTAMLMSRLYINLVRSSMNPVAALQEAQVWLRGRTPADVTAYLREWQGRTRSDTSEATLLQYLKYYEYLAKSSSAPPFAHPYYWAAFTVSGLDTE